MKLSEKCKAVGLKSLTELCEITSVSPQTLSNWNKNKPKLLNTVLMGAAVIKND